ncbi:hypothetical protein QWT87_05385 [Chryseobacterium sp. APV1]|uniref:Lipoprotein n=1 Tax=Chryseobacterium urinae TaxID=3058400 RepID=A0ABT8U2K4_9FLAO|nr:hypothetical protein [Chryseobacterium sp. APV1]MDO3424315.1 hypothetical protein [Chryseobacterium sp. APV1]
MKSGFFSVFLMFLLSCSEKYSGEITFKNCKVNYPLHDEEKERKINDEAVTNQWEYESALRELALCLCYEYDRKPTKEIKDKIIEIYKYKFEYYNRNDSFEKINFDSILMNRKRIFDPAMIVD